MRSFTSTVRTMTSKVTVIIGRTVLLALAVMAGLVFLGLVSGGLVDTSSTVPVQVPAAGAPTTDPSGMAPHERPTENPPAAGGDGYADGHLFNDAAALDTSRIDDLRGDPYGECVSRDGVLTPTGACVDGARIWRDEVDSGTWETLRGLGYAPEAFDRAEMWVPAEYVILGGEDGNTVLAVDVFRPVTPRAA